MDAVFERDNALLTLSWFDETGAAATPSSASYRIDDLSSGEEIRGDTALSASSSVTIELMYADTQILDENKVEEGRRLSATAIYGTDTDGNPKQKTVEYDFTVKNARFKSP